MVNSVYQIRQCENKACGLRYPLRKDNLFGVACPRCSSMTSLIDTLELLEEPSQRPESLPDIPLEALLDNVRSAWNVGSILRTADGAGIRRVYLCGITPTPENPLVRKTSLGAENTVSWQHYNDGLQRAVALKNQGKKLWAIETGANSMSLFELLGEQVDLTIVLVFGNEIIGIDPGILEQCEKSISLPMYGAKRSINVAVAFGIAAFAIRNLYNRLESIE
jgi:23S rRNA (guanosine2251-2'-O)-methyltransferase